MVITSNVKFEVLNMVKQDKLYFLQKKIFSAFFRKLTIVRGFQKGSTSQSLLFIDMCLKLEKK